MELPSNRKIRRLQSEKDACPPGCTAGGLLDGTGDEDSFSSRTNIQTDLGSLAFALRRRVRPLHPVGSD